MINKQIFTLALSAVVGVGLAVAGPAPQDQSNAPAHRSWQGHQMDPDQQVQRLSKRLKLSDEQKSQIKPILTDQMQQMQNIRQDTSLQPEDRRTKMRSVREDATNKIKAVLNDDQKKKYDDMQQQMRDRMQQRRQEHEQNGQSGGNSNPS